MKLAIIFSGLYACVMIALFVTFFQLVMKLRPYPKDIKHQPPPTHLRIPDGPPLLVGGRRNSQFENEVLNELFNDEEGVPPYREPIPEYSKKSSNSSFVYLPITMQSFGNKTVNSSSTGQGINGTIVTLQNHTRYVVLRNDIDPYKSQLKNAVNDSTAVLKSSRRSLGFTKADNDSIVFKIVSSDGDPTIEIKISKPIAKKSKKRKSRRVKLETKHTENGTTVLPTTPTIMANNFVIQVLPNSSLYLDTPNLYEDNNNSSEKLFGEKGIIIDNLVEIKPL